MIVIYFSKEDWQLFENLWIVFEQFRHLAFKFFNLSLSLFVFKHNGDEFVVYVNRGRIPDQLHETLHDTLLNLGLNKKKMVKGRNLIN